MPGLTNFIRHQVLRALGDNTSMPGLPTLWVSLFTVAPSSDGDELGGVLDETEWLVPRIPLLTFSSVPSTATPRWSIGPGEFGGWNLTTVGELRWTDGDTLLIDEGTVLSAGGVYDAETGGNLVAWDYLENPVACEPGTAVVIPTGEMRIRLHKEL